MARDARSDLEAELGRAARDDVWTFLVDDRYVDEYESGILDLADLVARYRSLARLGPGTRSAPREREVPPDERLIARGTILAERAGKLQEVCDFRERWLTDGLIAPSQLEEWIRGHLPEQPAVWGTFLLDADGNPADRAARQSTAMDRVSYRIPSDGWEHAAPVGTDGALRELKTLSENLGRWSGWQPSVAATFVLTGVPPRLPLARVTVSRKGGPLGVQIRIVLDVDPGMSPTAVAKLFRDARVGLKVRRRRASKRPMPQLLEFVQDRPNVSWPDRMVAWNAEFPSLQYTHVTNMQRDYQRARRLAEEEDLDF